jgi:hypothetical protein
MNTEHGRLVTSENTPELAITSMNQSINQSINRYAWLVTFR